MKLTESIRTDEEIIEHIKEILDVYVQPAVEQHGGEVNFLRYEDNILTLQLSGACSGCAGSTATLQYGIENMMRHHVPEIDAIEAEHDAHSTVNPYYSYYDEPDYPEV